MLRRKHFQRLDGGERTPPGVVVVQHAAGLDPAPLGHLVGLEVELTRLRHDAQVLGRLDGSQRGATQSVEPGADVAAVAEDQRRWPSFFSS